MTDLNFFFTKRSTIPFQEITNYYKITEYHAEILQRLRVVE